MMGIQKKSYVGMFVLGAIAVFVLALFVPLFFFGIDRVLTSLMISVLGGGV